MQRGDFVNACNKFKKWAVNFNDSFNASLQATSIAAHNCLGNCFAMATVSEYLVWEACTAFSLPQPSPTSPFLSRCGDYAPLVESFLTKGPLKKANNLAIISVCNSGISSVMKKITGDEDVHTRSMVAGFGYGVVISLATGMRGPNVLSVGVMCALFNGGMFKDERESALAKSGFFTNIMVVREAALSKSGFSTI